MSGNDDEPDSGAREDLLDHQRLDEPWWMTERIKSAERADAKLRADLNRRESARAAYRDIADAYYGSSLRLSDLEFRLISYLLRRADRGLGNCFPSQKEAAAKCCRPRSTYNRQLVSLRRKGWIESREFHHEGKQSSSLIVFCIPAGVLPLGGPWRGPVSWGNRKVGVPKDPRRRRLA